MLARVMFIGTAIAVLYEPCLSLGCGRILGVGHAGDQQEPHEPCLPDEEGAWLSGNEKRAFRRRAEQHGS